MTELDFGVFDKDTGAFVGMFALYNFDWSVPSAETGYWVATQMSGRGYATEAIAAVITLACGLGLVRLELRTHAGNERPRVLAERSGFALEGLLRRQRRCPHGKLADTCVYAYLPADTPS